MVHIFSNSTFSKMNSDGQKEIGRSGNCTSNSSYSSNHTSSFSFSPLWRHVTHLPDTTLLNQLSIAVVNLLVTMCYSFYVFLELIC